MGILDETMFFDGTYPVNAAQTPQPRGGVLGSIPMPSAQSGHPFGIDPDILIALGAGMAGSRNLGQGFGAGLRNVLAVGNRRNPVSIQEFEYARRNGYGGSFMDWQRHKGQLDGYGLQPMYGVGPDGNPVIMQLGKSGTAIQTRLPDGVTLSKEPIKMDAGTHFVLVDPITRQQVGIIPKNNQQAAAQTALGTAQGKAAGDAQAALPKIDGQANIMLGTIDGILKDPALNSSTGYMAWRQAIPGTDAWRFGQRAKQLEGQAFLQAFESLKGGGQITEIEGQKATQAIGRLSTAQNAKDYQSALEELRGVVEMARDRARSSAGNAPPPSFGQPEQTAQPTPPREPAQAERRTDGSIPSGIKPELWKHMTPEERALFQ